LVVAGQAQVAVLSVQRVTASQEEVAAVELVQQVARLALEYMHKVMQVVLVVVQVLVLAAAAAEPAVLAVLVLVVLVVMVETDWHIRSVELQHIMVAVEVAVLAQLKVLVVLAAAELPM
jgi:hypothetical protein